MNLKKLSLSLLVCFTASTAFADYEIPCTRNANFIHCPGTITNEGTEVLRVNMSASGTSIRISGKNRLQTDLVMSPIAGETSKVDLTDDSTQTHACHYWFETRQAGQTIYGKLKRMTPDGANSCGFGGPVVGFGLMADVDSDKHHP